MKKNKIKIDEQEFQRHLSDIKEFAKEQKKIGGYIEKSELEIAREQLKAAHDENRLLREMLIDMQIEVAKQRYGHFSGNMWVSPTLDWSSGRTK